MAKRTKGANAIDAVGSTSPAKSLFDRVAGYLDANDWQYHADRERGYMSMGCRINEAHVRVLIDVHQGDDWNRVVAFSTYPIFVPENRRPAVLDALNRVNHRLAFGNFQMDPADGEIRFRTTLESGKDMDDEMFERVLNGNLNVTNRNFAPLMAVAFGNLEPGHVMEMADRPDQSHLQ